MEKDDSSIKSGAERTRDWYARLSREQKDERNRQKRERRQNKKVSAAVAAGSNMAAKAEGDEMALADGDEMALADDVSALSLSNGGISKASRRKQFYERMEQRSLDRAQARADDVAAADTELKAEDARHAEVQKEAYESFTNFCGTLTNLCGTLGNLAKDGYVNYSNKIQESSNKKQDRISSKQALDMKACDRHLDDADEATKASMREQLFYDEEEDYDDFEEENYDAFEEQSMDQTYYRDIKGDPLYRNDHTDISITLPPSEFEGKENDLDKKPAAKVKGSARSDESASAKKPAAKSKGSARSDESASSKKKAAKPKAAARSDESTSSKKQAAKPKASSRSTERASTIPKTPLKETSSFASVRSSSTRKKQKPERFRDY